MQPEPGPIDPSRTLLLVTGAHLRAEACDRPLAYALKAEAQRRLGRLAAAPKTPRLLVCSDLWRINSDELAQTPTISLGGPGVNAWAAHLAEQLPTAFAVDDRLVIQMDPDMSSLLVSLWGMDHASTVEALTIFTQRYLDEYLEAVFTRCFL